MALKSGFRSSFFLGMFLLGCGGASVDDDNDAEKLGTVRQALVTLTPSKGSYGVGENVVVSYAGFPAGYNRITITAAGAPASTCSRVRLGVTTSGRYTLVNGTACVVGVTSSVGASCTRATAPRTTPS